jgi:hypothetical protein
MSLRMNVGLLRRLAGLLLFGLFSGVGTGTAAAQSVSGEGYGASVNNGGQTTKSGSTTLPAGGGVGVADSDSLGVGLSVAAGWTTSITSGAIGAQAASSQTISSLEDVNILGGTIRAKFVSAVASSTANGASTSSNSFGSVLTDLSINGVPVGPGDFTPGPNTRIDLPGVGFVLLNEQTPSGDGVRSSGMTVNMIHVVLIDALTGVQTGDIIVGSSSSAAGF